MNPRAQAEALFGSASRGDSDHLSDRDILIVDSNTDLLNSRRAELEAEGWSVASYTWNKLNRLSERGALFLQHLKLESVVIRDDRSRLKELLEGYKPKASYHDEILQNAALASIAETYPATAQGSLWAADVLYVCVRNYGVLHLANLQKYVFGFNAILEELAGLGRLTNQEVRAAYQLRLLKSLYRSGSKVPFSRTRQAFEEAAIAVPREVLSARCVSKPSIEIVSAAKHLRSEATAYHRLRNLEKIYVALLEIDTRYRDHPKLMLLKRWIEDPRSYTQLAEANERDLVTTALSLSGRCAITVADEEMAYGVLG